VYRAGKRLSYSLWVVKHIFITLVSFIWFYFLLFEKVCLNYSLSCSYSFLLHFYILFQSILFCFLVMVVGSFVKKRVMKNKHKKYKKMLAHVSMKWPFRMCLEFSQHRSHLLVLCAVCIPLQSPLSGHLSAGAYHIDHIHSLCMLSWLALASFVRLRSCHRICRQDQFSVNIKSAWRIL
jgi:hypothetical protein